MLPLGACFSCLFTFISYQSNSPLTLLYSLILHLLSHFNFNFIFKYFSFLLHQLLLVLLLSPFLKASPKVDYFFTPLLLTPLTPGTSNVPNILCTLTFPLPTGSASAIPWSTMSLYQHHICCASLIQLQ